ncbi:MAG: flagellar filament capping protein FliD [Desulfuromonadales bacterium]|nr:flagellar filament capping protein FliD [Desulfuromonadales bacterium]MBN2792071.1 flagellar filament capping protein FliD [Desulfuromonadales bacterium]
MSITFGGLATGLDTNAIVEQLMALERTPITRLETDKTWFQTRQAAFEAFDTKLKSFLSKIENLGSSDDLRQKSISASSENFLSVSASAEALPGASYQVEVVSLAQVQKNVTQGYADKTAQNFGTGELTLTVGDGEALTITIDEMNNSLEGIMQAINDADAGVNASIINDGTDNPYRLVLTGENVATDFSLLSTLSSNNGDVSAQLQTEGYGSQTADYFGNGTLDLSNGHQIILTEASNSLTDIMEAINAETGTTGVTASIVADGDNFVIALDNGATITATDFSGGYDGLSLTETQAASQAHIRVDTIDIYSDGNTLDEAIPGLTLDLLQAEEGEMTTVSVALDEDAIKGQIEAFVSGYNEVLSFISSQSGSSEDSSGGILGSDPGMNSVKRRLQGLLTTVLNNSGNFAALSQLGLETQKNGTITLDDEKLTSAIRNDLDSVENLLVGEDGNDGIAVKFQDYLEGITDSIDGLAVAVRKSTESNVTRIEDRIEQIEARLEKKEETMLKKFSAMEELVSGMNNQSSFLTQQLDMLTNMLTRDK